MDTGGDKPDNLVNAVIAQAIGDALRRARVSVGWSRAELVSRLPSQIHSQTLAAYERGVRQCTIERFVEICLAIGVSAPSVLGGALQRAEIDLTTIQIDLRAVLNDNNAELLPLRRWARKRLEDEPAGIVSLDWAVVQEMASMFGIARPDFVRLLITFTPQPAPWRR
jgi:transcriptional regulator with XRE-family HTH domain